MTTVPKKEKGGCLYLLFGTIPMMMGVLLAIVGVLSVLNVAFGWELMLKLYGSRTELPTDMVGAIALLALAVFFYGFGKLATSQKLKAAIQRKKILLVPLIGGIALVLYLLAQVVMIFGYGGIAEWGVATNNFWAVSVGESQDSKDYLLWRAVVYENVDAAEYLVEQGANPKLLVHGNETLLNVAAWDGNVELFEYLLAQGADPSIPDEYGNTPLVLVLGYLPELGRSNPDDILTVVKLLVTHGAPLDALNEDDMTALELAEKHELTAVVAYLKSQQ